MITIVYGDRSLDLLDVVGEPLTVTQTAKVIGTASGDSSEDEGCICLKTNTERDGQDDGGESEGPGRAENAFGGGAVCRVEDGLQFFYVGWQRARSWVVWKRGIFLPSHVGEEYWKRLETVDRPCV